MLPPSPCWVQTNAGTQTPTLPTEVHHGDNLVWLNGAWVSVPSSLSSPCGNRKFYGLTVDASVNTAADLVSSGAALEKRLGYFNPATHALFIFDHVSGMWGTYTACNGDVFINTSTNNTYTLPVVSVSPAVPPIVTGLSGPTPGVMSPGGTHPAPTTQHPDTVFGDLLPKQTHTVPEFLKSHGAGPLDQSKGYYNCVRDVLFQYDTSKGAWVITPAVKGSEFIDVGTGNIYLRGT